MNHSVAVTEKCFFYGHTFHNCCGKEPFDEVCQTPICAADDIVEPIVAFDTQRFSFDSCYQGCGVGSPVIQLLAISIIRLRSSAVFVT